MKRVIFLNRFFPPDHSATSQLVGDLAEYLAGCGHDVHVITSRQLYDDPQARLPGEETFNGVQVHRVTTTQFGRSKLAGRAFDYFSFYASARRALLSIARPGDAVVAMTDPPLISLVAMNVAARRRTHLVNWLQDVYPEVATQLGVPFLKGPILRGIMHFRDRSLTKATVSVVVGELMAEKVASRGVAKDRIRVITNWSEDEAIVPVAADLNPLRQRWQLEGKFVVGYSGNLGRAHEFNTILAAAERLGDQPDIVFLCIGGGHLLGRLAQLVQRHGHTNFRFLGYQERAILRDSLGVPDVHWVSLRPELEGLIVPSKVYGIAAAGRPIIAICAENGEIARMIGQYHCGIAVRPGDSDALVASLLRLYGDTALRAQMGRNARAMLEGHFTRRQSLSRWGDVITHTASDF